MTDAFQVLGAHAPSGLALLNKKGVQDLSVYGSQRFYVRATATLSEGGEDISAVAYAREAETKKGMDEAQISGSSSSYARKYALNGLFAIEDGKDPDATETHGKEAVQTEEDIF